MIDVIKKSLSNISVELNQPIIDKVHVKKLINRNIIRLNELELNLSKEMEKEREKNKLVIPPTTLQQDAKECLINLATWDNNEFKGTIAGHPVGKLRPMIMTKKLLNKIIES